MPNLRILLSVFFGAPWHGARRVLVVLHHLSWGLPNVLIGMGAGVFCLLFLRAKCYRWRDVVVVHYPGNRTQAATLGPIILGSGNLTGQLLQHERGHWLQSVALGPFYYFVIGIPSLLHAAWFIRYRTQAPHREYFRFYTEAWADAWGGSWGAHAHEVRHWREYLKPRKYRVNEPTNQRANDKTPGPDSNF